MGPGEMKEGEGLVDFPEATGYIEGRVQGSQGHSGKSAEKKEVDGNRRRGYKEKLLRRERKKPETRESGERGKLEKVVDENERTW